MKLYDELAEWWPLFSAPEDYAEEAAFFARVLAERVQTRRATVLELGSGGGNNAFYLKSKFEMTLVDLSPQMLAVSRALNPECDHREGDMRTVNLGRTFDAVFVHDAIAYMTSAADLSAAIRTAFRHCRAGGVALFVPDCVRETFVAETKHGGHDGDEPQPSLSNVDRSIPIRPTPLIAPTSRSSCANNRGDTRVVHDSHIEGIFPRAEWMRLLREAGFEPRSLDRRMGTRNLRREASTLRSAARFQNLRQDDRDVRRITSARPHSTSARCRFAIAVR